MSLARLMATAWRENLLVSVLVELTYRCNLDCFFCYNDLGLKGKPLSRERYFRFFDELRDLEVLHLTLSGGEPLAHPDFLLLGARARELGFVVRVKSNGHALRGELARRVRDEVDPFLVEVSLHGATAATHDRQTRVPGSFERLLANLAELRALGLRVKLNSTLTAWNEGEVEAMFVLADALGLPLQFDPEVTPRDDGGREPLAVAPSREGVLRLFRLQTERGRSRDTGMDSLASVRSADEDVPVPVGKHCGAGSSGLAVDPFGNVYPCVQWRRPVGNLHEKSLREIWQGSAGLKEVRELTAQAKDVVGSHGPRAALLNFCPGMASVHSGGDPLRIYPSALQRKELLETVLEAEATRGPLLPVIS
ncbi:MAG TPA: radical SAM protein [Thermoanaerobaculia bacterium]|jgi:MoaA/NifB/PqqE/SkfB family radical SAM enzyme|nr:radical SAM protein [Thermoanaerobaculia bacterium]